MDVHLYDKPLLKYQTKDIIDRFMTYNPFQEKDMYKSWKKVIAEGSIQRSEVSEALYRYNKTIGNDKKSLDNCRIFADPATVVIVTGQQPGLFTGPLYTIYKIITTIKLAEYYSSRFRTSVIPIFWNATEDHDISEISSFQLPGKKWLANFPQGGIAAESFPTSPFCEEILSEYLSSVTESNYKKEIEALLSISFPDYGRYSSSIISRLFQGTGLVILEPRILRDFSVTFFQDSIGQRKTICEKLNIAGKEMEQRGIPTSFHIKPEKTGLFFLQKDGVRTRIFAKDNGFTMGDQRLNEQELLTRIRETPKAFSPAAFLRPILQSLILPTMSYVAGPGEFRYHCQLLPLFRLFNTQMPVIYPRNHATIITQKEAKLARLLSLKDKDFFTKPAALYYPLPLPSTYEKAFRDAIKEAGMLKEHLSQQINDLIPQSTLDNFSQIMTRHIEKLKQKCLKAYLQDNRVDNARIDRFFQSIYPNNRDQERTINILYFLEKNGLDFISLLMKHLDPIEQKHYILYTKT